MVADNPAGRLAEMFDAIRGIDEPMQVEHVWARAFGYDAGDRAAAKRYRLEAALLLNATELQATALQSDQAVAEGVRASMTYSQEWAKTIFGWDVNPGTGNNYSGSSLVDTAALVSLHQLSHALHYAAPEAVPRVKDIDHVDEYLRLATEKLREIIGDLQSSDELPSGLRVRWCSILSEALTAIEFVRYRGYEVAARALQNATHEVGSEAEDAATYSDDTKDSLASRVKLRVLELTRIANEVARNLAVPTGATYILFSKDAAGGAAIMASGISYSELLSYRNRRSVEQSTKPKELEAGDK